MRILVTGSAGQLGRALQTRLAGNDLLLLDLPQHDITDQPLTCAVITTFEPHIVIHGAAMTDVERCEREPDLAYRINALGTQNVALACQECGAAMVYVSTDYVFDGTKDGRTGNGTRPNRKVSMPVPSWPAKCSRRPC